mmetsp:Transcript_9927/g.15982  ORF Transcript_9927/g.15982 Transcript_9927/m.15982 type:complete len:767 (+) Transcript_9927:156-2456(+)
MALLGSHQNLVSHNRSPSMMQAVSWQFKHHKNGEWKSFLPKASLIIDQGMANGQEEIKFKVSGCGYIINLKKMECTVEGTKRGYPIRKTGGKDLKTDLVKSALESMKKEALAAKAFVPPYHLIYKIKATNGYLGPVLVPQANIGIAGRLIVTAIRGRHLYDTQSMGHQDPYIRFSLEGRSKRKKIVYAVPKCVDGGQNPVWNHTVEIPISSEDQFLRMSVWSKRMVADSLIGRARLPLHGVLPFISPPVAFYNEENKSGGYNSNNAAYENLFLCTGEYARMCCSYSHRSWFELVRDLKSTHMAGEILLEFRFYIYRASKIIDWNSAEGKKQAGSIRRAPKIFGEPLKIGLNSSEVKIPQPIYDCVEFLTEHGLDSEGIFRVPGDAKKVGEMKSLYDRRQEVSLQGINEVAGLLKLYFRELPEPLIPYTHYKGFITVPSDSSSTEDMVEKYKIVMSTMDPLTRNILRYLTYFLKKITDKADVNKMLPKNVATCWAPSLMRSKNENDPANIRNIPMSIESVEKLILYNEEVFGRARIKEEPTAMKFDPSSSALNARLDIDNFSGSDDSNKMKTSLRPSVLKEIKEVASPSSVQNKMKRIKARRNRWNARKMSLRGRSPTASSLESDSSLPGLSARAREGKEGPMNKPHHTRAHVISSSTFREAQNLSRSREASPVRHMEEEEGESSRRRARNKSSSSRSRSRSPSGASTPQISVSKDMLKSVKLKSSGVKKRHPPPPPPKKPGSCSAAEKRTADESKKANAAEENEKQ